MRMTVDDPRALPSLIALLREGDCLAAQAGPASVDVRLPWPAGSEDSKQAWMELVFFARAWAAATGVAVSLAL
jgi:hypothetical protein